MIATVRDIQVCGGRIFSNLEDAVRDYLKCLDDGIDREKLNFSILLPNGETKHITIRQEDNQIVAYGDFDGLPNALSYAREIMKEDNNMSDILEKAIAIINSAQNKLTLGTKHYSKSTGKILVSPSNIIKAMRANDLIFKTDTRKTTLIWEVVNDEYGTYYRCLKDRGQTRSEG